MDQMKTMDKEQSAQLQNLNDTMVNLTKSIGESMSMFANMQAHAMHDQSQMYTHNFQPDFPVGPRDQTQRTGMNFLVSAKIILLKTFYNYYVLLITMYLTFCPFKIWY